MSKRLEDLLAKTKGYQMTPEEREEQRQSWARGQLALTRYERALRTGRVYTLENWSTCTSCGPFSAPEVCTVRLQGHRVEDGQNVVTSAIKSAHGREVTTRSGSVYRLGKPDAEWIAWLAERGIPFDPARPVKVRT